MKLFRSLAGAALAALAAFSTPAQHLGDVSIATVQATIANGVTCTGAAQNFTTGDVALPAFNNIGQTSHLATATSTAAQFQMEIDGIDNLGNVYRLSDLQLGVPSSAKGGLVVTAAGYMPRIRVSVTCSSGSTFSVSYSGSFSPQPPQIGAALLVSIDKLPFQGAPANAGASTTFQSPTGNSAGTIIFQYAAAGPSGSTISVQCLSNAGTNLSLFTFSPTTVSTAQLFSVAATVCPFVTLSYTSGGASATTYTLEYAFTTSGSQPATSAADPCLSPSTLKQSLPIPLTNAAVTVQVIPLTAGQTIFPCTIDLTATWGATNFTYTWEYGTGALCGTGTTALSGGHSLVNANIVQETASGPTQFQIPPGNAFCIVMSAATGGTGGIAGHVTFVKQ